MVIRVLVATGVRAYREGLQRVLQGAEGIALAGIASTAEQAVEEACKLLPSVILLDIGMAKSLALAGQMVGIPRTCGFVMLGKPEAYADVVVCLPAEIVAFVSRDATVADLLSAIRAAGGVDLSMRVSVPPPAAVIRAIPVALAITGYPPRHHASAIAHLTEREMEILKLIQQGLPNKTISRQLGIELSTVKNHVHSILAKLGAHNRGEAISLLYRYESTERAVPNGTAEPETILPLEQPAVA
jgi:two-component system, NarL family, nitrate/nitrite response regulator NarL